MLRRFVITVAIVLTVIAAAEIVVLPLLAKEGAWPFLGPDTPPCSTPESCLPITHRLDVAYALWGSRWWTFLSCCALWGFLFVPPSMRRFGTEWGPPAVAGVVAGILLVHVGRWFSMASRAVETGNGVSMAVSAFPPVVSALIMAFGIAATFIAAATLPLVKAATPART